jgi:hypothetical protein
MRSNRALSFLIAVETNCEVCAQMHESQVADLCNWVKRLLCCCVRMAGWRQLLHADGRLERVVVCGWHAGECCCVRMAGWRQLLRADGRLEGVVACGSNGRASCWVSMSGSREL